MDAREVVRRWHAAMRRYHQRRPEDEQWRKRVNAALARCMVRVQELEDEEMPDLHRYKGPYQVVIQIDGDANEKLVGAGLDWQGARDLSDYYAEREHVRSVLIRDEPSQQTVEIPYDRNEQLDDPDKEQSEGDPNRVG